MDAMETRGETTLHLDADAAALLAQLAPEPERRGPYVSDLIRAVAQAGAQGNGSLAARMQRRTRSGNRVHRVGRPRPPLSEGDQQLEDDKRHAGSGG